MPNRRYINCGPAGWCCASQWWPRRRISRTPQCWCAAARRCGPSRSAGGLRAGCASPRPFLGAAGARWTLDWASSRLQCRIFGRLAWRGTCWCAGRKACRFRQCERRNDGKQKYARVGGSRSRNSINISIQTLVRALHFLSKHRMVRKSN